jgi:IS5 family transposase
MKVASATLEMYQPQKGNQLYFGMKMHIGVDDTLGLIHSIDTTSASGHDIVPADKMLHGEERRVFGMRITWSHPAS